MEKGEDKEFAKDLWIECEKISESITWGSVMKAYETVKKIVVFADASKTLEDNRGAPYIYGIFYCFSLVDVADEKLGSQVDLDSSYAKQPYTVFT